MYPVLCHLARKELGLLPEPTQRHEASTADCVTILRHYKLNSFNNKHKTRVVLSQGNHAMQCVFSYTQLFVNSYFVSGSETSRPLQHWPI